MVSVKEDLTGKTFGRWNVLCQTDDYINPKTNKRTARWLCECECDKKTQKKIVGSSLKNGSTKSCGCLKSELTSTRNKKYNTFDLSREHGVGYTLKGEEFLFDIEDYEKIKDYCWYIDKDGYVVTNDYSTGEHKRLSMHRLVLNFPSDTDIDHIHGESTKRDNRKSNLRPSTHSQNMMNKDVQSNSTSGVTGVSWYSKSNKWRSYIIINRKFIHLGLFDNFDDAVRVRQEAEEKYFGEFSYNSSMNN